MNDEVKPGSAQTGSLEDRVRAVLERVRPFLQRDGGDVELADINAEEGIVFVRLQGACQGCPGAAMTLQMGIEKELKAHVPEVQKVVQV
jgi:Fe-S cluster biogenesis protein NfuA